MNQYDEYVQQMIAAGWIQPESLDEDYHEYLRNVPYSELALAYKEWRKLRDESVQNVAWFGEPRVIDWHDRGKDMVLKAVWHKRMERQARLDYLLAQQPFTVSKITSRAGVSLPLFYKLTND